MGVAGAKAIVEVPQKSTGITDLVSPDGTVTITHPTGPTTDIDVTLIGDVTGLANANSISLLQGHTVLAASPVVNGALFWNGTDWVPKVIPGTILNNVAGTLYAPATPDTATITGANALLTWHAAPVEPNITDGGFIVPPSGNYKWRVFTTVQNGLTSAIALQPSTSTTSFTPPGSTCTAMFQGGPSQLSYLSVVFEFVITGDTPGASQQLYLWGAASSGEGTYLGAAQPSLSSPPTSSASGNFVEVVAL